MSAPFDNHTAELLTTAQATAANMVGQCAVGHAEFTAQVAATLFIGLAVADLAAATREAADVTKHHADELAANTRMTLIAKNSGDGNYRG